MNEDDQRRIFKAKRKRPKKRCRERKKEEAKQARSADRQRRIQQEAEHVIQTRVDQGDLVFPIEKKVLQGQGQPGQRQRICKRH